MVLAAGSNTSVVKLETFKEAIMDEKCWACQLEGPLCAACGLPLAQHPSPDTSFSTCADALAYRIKRAAAYWEERRVADLMQIFRDADAKEDEQ
jgi:hypothetical protein